MLMEAELQSHVAFYLTGKTSSEGLEALEGLDLRPALLAAYRDLTALRYDFPVVLAQQGTFVESLTGLVDGALQKLGADGNGGDRLQKQALRAEREVRILLAEGAQGSLSALWNQAASRLASKGDQALAGSLSRVHAALQADGEVLDCNEALPASLLSHAWNRVQEERARRLRDDVQRLVLKLTDIVSAELAHSDAGLSAQSLKASVGGTHADAFDFQAMSRILGKTFKRSLSKSRHDRIRALVATLKAHRFSPSKALHAGEAEPYAFVFQNCAQALKAYRERLPKMVELARALAVAELEISGEYSEERHDALFEAFGATGLEAKDLSLFPSYLVCLKAASLDAAENARLMDILSSGLPMKVLVQTDDILETPALGGRFAVGLRSKQLASMAIALNEVYVLQSSASNLLQYRDRIQKGLVFAGPALFSVYSGATPSASELPPYLNAAAAMESRAFPACTYDPSAGPDWASRFHLDANSQAECDWPLQSVQYEDEEHQRISEEVAFTLIDFVACDRRFAGHFARVPRAKWNGTLMPVREGLARVPNGLPDKVPYLTMVDRNNVLQKVIVDDQVVREARRCADMWRSLQELGGIHNSHAERLLERERSAWEEKLRAAEAAAKAQPSAVVQPAVHAPAASAAPAAAAAAAQPEAEQAPSSDEPYIETPRCTTCEECVRLNTKMFVYDGNKQAYIKDLAAGTYRQLVEAAENCQVSIIHPGKPRNPNEPGLEELLKRAEPFL
jgi:hypothetical protein